MRINGFASNLFIISMDDSTHGWIVGYIFPESGKPLTLYLLRGSSEN